MMCLQEFVGDAIEKNLCDRCAIEKPLENTCPDTPRYCETFEESMNSAYIDHISSYDSTFDDLGELQNYRPIFK